MGRYKAYPAYKDSGIAWLGTIPECWRLLRLKFATKLHNDKVEPTRNQKYIGLENVSSWTGKYIPMAEQTAEGTSNRYFPGAVLFGKLRPYLAKALLANDVGLCSSEFLVLQGKYVNPSYLHAFMLTEGFINLVDSSTYGSKMPRASWDDISSLLIPIPSPGEQEKISLFLEHETSKIDTLIAKQRRLIELLREKRQAVISRVVTKGLNPDAPMKDSGVAWLGEVPEHWTVTRLGFVSMEVQTGPFGSQLHAEDYIENGIPIVNPANIQDGCIVPNWSSSVDAEAYARLKRHRLSEGNIVFARRGELGRCAVITRNEAGWLCGTGSLKVVLKQNDLEPEFAHLFLSTSFVRDALSLESKGSTMENLNAEILSKLAIVYPDKEEQKQIIQHVRATFGKLAVIVEKAQSTVSRLKERRTALISAAVTGKIDVRDWQPPAQEVPEREGVAV
jgi:type I restriction enzyme S subunit